VTSRDRTGGCRQEGGDSGRSHRNTAAWSRTGTGAELEELIEWAPVHCPAASNRDGKTTSCRSPNGQTGAVLLIDAANVVGARPTGWWRDRAGAARAFVEKVRAAVESGEIAEPVVVVLEGKARDGVQSGAADGVTVLHAPGSGDDMLIDVAANAGEVVTLVTADRELRQRAEVLGADVVGPTWLLELLES
jgi:hypothetical protein